MPLYAYIFYLNPISSAGDISYDNHSGFLFGTILASVYALVALLASSFCVFKLSKKMFGHYIQERYSHELKKFNDNFKKYGFYYLLVVRALPVIPFFIVNLAAGFTHVSTKTFIITTAIGHCRRYFLQLPG